MMPKELASADFKKRRNAEKEKHEGKKYIATKSGLEVYVTIIWIIFAAAAIFLFIASINSGGMRADGPQGVLMSFMVLAIGAVGFIIACLLNSLIIGVICLIDIRNHLITEAEQAKVKSAADKFDQMAESIQR